jgi:hypothetical protein
MLKKEIILVGTYHFEQQQELIAKKEQEVYELVDYLANHRPTKIALEWERSEENELNYEFHKVDDIISINEIYQVGFRLAGKLNHPKVYAVNWTGEITSDTMSELNSAIQDLYPAMQEMMQRFIEGVPTINLSTPLIDSYKMLNNKKLIKQLEELYLSFVVVKNNKGRKVGFDFLSKWMERELMIFRNVLNLSESEERVLLIIGSDHLWMLRKLFEGNGWRVINPFGDD